MATQLPSGKSLLQVTPPLHKAAASLPTQCHDSSFVLKPVQEASARLKTLPGYPLPQDTGTPRFFLSVFKSVMEGLPSLVRVWLSKLSRGESVIFPACMSHMAISDGPEYRPGS